MNGLIVDLFAGGGGASVALAAALGREPDLAINHDPVALAVHKANHPGTRHLEADVWEVQPLEATGGRRVAILWASPDCTHFSVAKGDVPRDHGIRSLAWVVVDWAKAVRPAVIFLENVREFQTWGPLGADGRPDRARMGETFHEWRRALEALGYVVDHRVLDASVYGAPTRRRRLFLVARCDGQPIVWPSATHGPGLLPLHTAAECIDWSLPCPSIFERKKPLAEKTLWRIAQGIRRYVLESPSPFIVKVNHGKREFRGQPPSEPLSTITGARRGHAVVTPSIVEMNANNKPRPVDEPLGVVTTQHNRFNVVAPTLVQTGYGERKGQRARALDIEKPLGTIIAGGRNGCGNGKHALVSAFLTKHFGDPQRQDRGGGTVIGSELGRPVATITARDHHGLTTATLCKMRGDCHSSSMGDPMPTITAGGKRGGVHVAEIRAFLTAYYGTDGTGGQTLIDPLRTVTAKHRLGLVTIEGRDWQIVDIGMRMLQPRELLRAQFGTFAEAYDLGEARTKEAQVRLIGNSVAPECARALIEANVPRDAEAAA